MLHTASSNRVFGSIGGIATMNARWTAWVMVLILFCYALGAQAARQPFRAEVTWLGELQEGVMSADEMAWVAQRYIEERATEAGRLLAGNPRDIIQNEIFNLYDGARAGKPRLFFSQLGPKYWAVPLQRGGTIGGFIKFDPYSGKAVGTPNWGAGGRPLYSIDARQWEEMESIATLWTGERFGDETRLLVLMQEDGHLLYLASPRGDDVVRADVSSILAPTGLDPRLLTKAPAERPLRSLLSPDHQRRADEQAETAPALLSLWQGAMQPPDVFSLSVMPPIKNQGGYGSCTGHAVSSVGDWWLCGSICYLGTGDSELYDCLCEKDPDGSCECIDPILSRQNAYDRLRYLGGADCRQGLCAGGCPGQGGACLSSLVTSGVECGTCPYGYCEGSDPVYAPHIFLNDGLCTEECASYGCDPGCALSNGGSGQCTDVCPDVAGDCGDDFVLRSYFIQSTNDLPGLREAIYHHGIILAASGVCLGQPGCDGWSSYGCLCDPCEACTSRGGHAWDLVGYNAPDSLFYFQNSWGYWSGDGRGELGNSFIRRWCYGETWGFEGYNATIPRIFYMAHAVDDSSGNADGRPDPGETIELWVTVKNAGVQADSVEATLSSSNPSAVIITDSTASRQLPLLHNQTASFHDPFVFEVDPGAECEDITFYLAITAAGGYAETDSFVQRIGRPDVLLVDDDGGAINEEPFQQVFGDREDFLWDEHEVETEGSPDGALLSRYPLVVWLTGDATANTVTADDTLALGAFLDGGGGLFLTGANIGEEISGWPFYSDRLHAGFVSGTTANYVLDGVPTSALCDTLLICEEPSKDVIEPLAEADTALIYLDMDGGVAAITYVDSVGRGATGHRMVYFGFDFGWIDDQSPVAMHKPELMDSVLTWLMLVTGVSEEPPFDPERPHVFLLKQNSPNPFGGSTVISYAVPSSGEQVCLRVYNIAGQLVRELVDQPHDAGMYTVRWDGRNGRGSQVSSGVYFYRLEAGSRSLARKMVMLK
ncbi:MAG: hypothetical protein AMJ46_07880 [Latescibacteria bacterium DG_63]|uniref:FlgD/Vpr Ig-like domain-containing protein n=1 Tax=candidate division TA06 bacterium SM1_40 TaxID=1703773 RepID=A0A0S8J973_UNCT6|nr:MAG: hypothetical protein AMJ46_07880 [Latescibacteria bacterium DG_63]KPL05874.1 MAG: hypothetical protein AMJ71_10590 [candidate division TA06 bacterium SM1_40]